MSYTDLVNLRQECLGLSKLIIKCYEFYQKNNKPELLSDIQNYLSQYQKCKSKIFIIIGSLKDSTKSSIDEDLDAYMTRCDELSQIGKLMTESSTLDDDMDLLEEENSDWESDTEKGKKPKSEENSEENDSISEKDLLGDDILKDAKEGGINELSDVTVVDGEGVVIVGEKYKYGMRELLLKIKNAETREEQLEVAGFSSENDLDEFVSKLKVKEYVNHLIKKYGIDELYNKSLESLRERVNIYCSRIGSSNQNMGGRFKRIIKSINECLDDPSSTLNIDESLYHMTKCFCAVKFENDKFTSQLKLLDSIKIILNELNDIMKKSKKTDMPTFDFDIFESLSEMSGDDNLKELIQLQRRWIKPMTQLEIYFGKMSEFINSTWIVYDANNISVECAKYRLYLLNKANAWSKSDSATLAKMIAKYEISDFGSIKKFIEATVSNR
jgi:hypothetical protein